jgi:hypothetical protein
MVFGLFQPIANKFAPTRQRRFLVDAASAVMVFGLFQPIANKFAPTNIDVLR